MICAVAGCGGRAVQATPSPAPTAEPLTEPTATPTPTYTPVPLGPGKAGNLQILFINVGRADSALVSLGGKHWLIDTGTAESLPALVRALRAQGVDTLEGVILSHTHADHIGGLAGILRLFSVKTVYAGAITVYKKDGVNAVDEIAQAAGQTVRRLSHGDEIPLGASAKLRVLGPLVPDAEEDNNNSLVLRLEDGAFTCLFAGDTEFPEEATLLSANAISRCTALKVADHGNGDASSKAFITAISPKIAVISTDSTVDTDTPAPQVLANLASAGSTVFVTQDAETGILLTVQNGTATAEKYTAAPPPAPPDIRVDSLDKKADMLVLRNDGADAADLSHAWIAPENGGELFFFPAGTVLGPGDSLTISGNQQPGALLWENKKVWRNKESDPISLYDAWGNLIWTVP